MRLMKSYNNNLLIILVAFVIASCNPNKKKSEDQKIEQQLVVSPEAIQMMKQHLISIDQARVLQDTYVSTRYTWINERLKLVDTAYAKNGDTREFWFSLDVLKAYIAYIEENSPNDAKDLGIRIYSGAYPAEDAWKKGQPGLSTVFLVPTIGEPQKQIGNGFAPLPPVQTNQTKMKALNLTQGGDPPKNL